MLKDFCMLGCILLACSYACPAFCFVFISLFFCQVMHTALSFDSAPKIKLSTSITHETLCTHSHDRPTHRGGGISGTCFSLLLSNDMQCTLPLTDIPFFGRIFTLKIKMQKQQLNHLDTRASMLEDFDLAMFL